MGLSHELRDHYPLHGVPIVEKGRINGHHLVAVHGHPAIAFILDKDVYQLPSTSLLHQDMGTRLELIHRGLCGLPTVVAPDLKYVTQNALASSFEYMNQVAKATGIPQATKLYVRTRVPGGTTSQNLESRGLLAYDIGSDDPSFFHVGGDLNGQEVYNLDTWKSGLPSNTQFMIHLENKLAQKRSIHIKIQEKSRGGFELLCGTDVLHARQLGRAGKWFKIDDVDDPISEIERIAEGRDHVASRLPVSDPDIARLCNPHIDTNNLRETDQRILQWLLANKVQRAGVNELFWFDSHPSSGRQDAYKIARAVEFFMPQIMSIHATSQELFTRTVVSEFRCHVDPVPSVHLMDVNSDTKKDTIQSLEEKRQEAQLNLR